MYCAKKRETETVAEYLRAHGLNAAAYHAGLEPQRRSRIQVSAESRFSVDGEVCLG